MFEKKGNLQNAVFLGQNIKISILYPKLHLY